EYSQVSQEEDSSSTAARLLPEFVGQVPNVTVQVGREARLPCIIRNLATYRAAWIRDEEKNILTLQRQMVTRDPRISLQEESQMDIGNGGADDAAQEANRIRYFVLIIRNVQVEDRGGYMCQINLNPMKAQVGHLRVVVPPDIIDEESSDDVTIVEGANVTLKCRAKGYPQPNIEWRREDGNRVPLGGSRRIM
ncbi:PREDICTED: limbic system-associated membrane protein-like, partial [Rhagoletis zephyria]|uniref:limbic system-associated membrane protein-like n=1 Tax=Rhagoletis zephyria TaxID=28612 RepID=UPI000811734F